MREYLNARIAQSIDELKRVQAELDADPKNIEKAGRLMKAHATLRELRSELAAQAGGDAQTDGEERNTDPADEESSTTEPGVAFRAAQADKAEEIMKAAGMETKYCPKCRAVLPERSALCFCGFAFAGHNMRTADSDTQQLEDHYRPTP